MVDIAKLQKKRNTLLLAPKRKLTSVVKPTTVDTTPVARTPYVPSASINTSAGSGTSVIAPTTTTTPTTSAPATAPAAAPKSNPTTDALKKAAIIGGTTLAAKAIIDNYNKPAAPATKPAPQPATKPAPAPAPVVKPPTSVVIPPALQKEQDAQVKAAIAAKDAADHNALVGSFDQGTKVGLPSNTIPNNTPARAGDVNDDDFTYHVRSEGDQDALVNSANIAKDAADHDALVGSFDQGTRVGLDYNTIPNYTPSEETILDESMFDFDQGTDVGLDYNTIPNNTPAEAGTIDESMFDDPNGVEMEDFDPDNLDPNDPMFTPEAGADPLLVQDDAGNLFLANADGSYTPADASGNAIGEPIFIGGDEAGVGTDYADSGFGDTALDTDGFDGGAGYEAYDDAGNLFFVGDDGSFTLLEPAPEEPNYGYDFDTDLGYYEEPPPYVEPDLSYLDDFIYEDPNYGYDFSYDPSYYENPPTDYYESDLSYLDEFKRGGQVQKMKKGGLPHFYTGGGAYDSMDPVTYSDVGYQAETSPVDMGGSYAGTEYENMIPTATASNPASIADMEYLYSEDPTNSDSSAYYTTVNNDSSGYYPNQASNMEESVFNPYDLHADESLMEDEEGRKFAVNSNGDYRLIEDSKVPTISDPRVPNTTPTPRTTSTTSGGGGFNFKDMFSADNIKALAGAGLTTAGLMTLYNSMKDKESTYQPAAYTPPAIPARTTDFGMGPARTVTPQMGGLQTMTPSQQEELYTNLGVAGYEREHEEPVEDQPMAEGGYAQPSQPASPSYFTYGMPQDPLEVLGVKQPQQRSEGGGLQMKQGGLPHPTAGVPIVQGRQDYRQGAAVSGEGDGQSDDIPAMLADGEYVFDSDVVAALGNGSNKAGAEVLDKFREAIRSHKRSAPIGKIPPKAKSPLAYLKEAQ
jgi:hypothetical protein